MGQDASHASALQAERRTHKQRESLREAMLEERLWQPAQAAGRGARRGLLDSVENAALTVGLTVQFGIVVATSKHSAQAMPPATEQVMPAAGKGSRIMAQGLLGPARLDVAVSLPCVR